MMANRFRYVFLALLSVLTVVFMNDRTALATGIALLFFWVTAVANTIILRRHNLRLSVAFNYIVAVLDCLIIFVMIVFQAELSEQRPDYVLALKNENFWILLFPLLLQSLQFRIKPVVLTLASMLAIQYSLIALALADHAPLTTSFQEARMGGKLFLMDALLKRPAIVIIVGLVIIYSIHRTIQMLRSLEDSKQRSLILSRYFSPEIVKEITATPDIVQSGHRQKVTILFADIRDFTPLSESISPDELVAFLAEFREQMTQVIFASGGSIDKFIGDAIMATFGTPRPSPLAGKDSSNAVTSALGMGERLDAINADRKARQLEPIRIGIGIHSGEAIVGNIGKGNLLEYSVIGDTVNTASRIEDQCKIQGTDIIISSAVYSELDEKVKSTLRVSPLGPTQVKGKKEALQLFAISARHTIEGDLKNPGNDQ